MAALLVTGCEVGPDPRPGSQTPAIRGFNFTHEGFGGRGGGYGSPEALASLDRLQSLGANTISVVPYAFMADPSVPELRRPRRGETDPRVITTIRAAQDRGMQVLLKPQIWLRGSWPGEIEMKEEDDWDAFFETYEEWIAHYARLAEREGVDIFSVGVEMSRASRRETDWRDLIDGVAEQFSGDLVYAANWYDEYEHVSFWDALDYVGVNVYYPLSDAPDATDEQLLRGAIGAVDEVEGVARSTGQPVLITEAGFGSSRAPWVQPHASDARSLVTSPSDQARAYEAFIQALSGKDWLAGVLFWKWPSHGLPGRQDRPTYSPIGRPVEGIIAEWWTR